MGAGILSACSSDPTIIEYEDPDAEPPEDDSGPDAKDAQPDRARRDGGGDADADAGNDAKADADAMSDADARPDAKGKDADADVVFADTGTACSPIGLTQAQSCGFCGSRERVCADLQDSGAATWAEWGACLHSVENGCTPGEMIDASCGLCGSAALKCQNNCKLPAIPAGSCKNQGVCAPGEAEYLYGVSCDAGGRTHTCEETCQWGDLSECMFEDMPEIQVPAVVGDKASLDFTFTDAGMLAKPSTTLACPTVDSGTSLYAAGYVRIMNNTGLDARVSIWHGGSSTFPEAGVIDTVMMLYDTGERPRDNKPAERWGCMLGTTPNNSCAGKLDPTMCKSSWAGYTDIDGGLPGNTVVIPAGFFLIVYSGTNSTTAFGPYSVNVMTHDLSP